MIKTEAMERAVAEAPLGGVDAGFFRVVPETAAEFGLEDGPSFASHNRYNQKDHFGALYFGDRPEVCRATVQARGHLPGRSRPHVLLSYHIHVEGILDLTEEALLKTLGLERRDLVRPASQPNAYDAPNRLALAAYRAPKICGILTPDATETGRTLALYPAKLLALQDRVRLKNRLPF